VADPQPSFVTAFRAHHRPGHHRGRSQVFLAARAAAARATGAERAGAM